MIKTKNGSQPFSEKSKFFKGKETLVDLFFNDLKLKDNSKPEVLVFYGSSGIGKTRLTKELCDKLEKEKNNLWAFAELGNPLYDEPDKLLLFLRNHFNKKYNVIFPSFDIAYSLFWQKSNLDLTVLNKNFPLTDGKGPVNYIIRKFDEFPGKGFTGIIGEIFNMPASKYNQWWRERGKIELSNILFRNAKELLINLPVYWIEDFKDFLKNSKKDVVIFFDSYESLFSENKKYESYLNEEFFQNLIEQLNEILFVITSRDNLNWTEKDIRWKKIIKNIRVDKFLQLDIKSYLKHSGIDNTEIINFIDKASKDNPFLLNLSLDIYKEIKRNGIREPELSDFPNSEEKAPEKLLSVLNESESKIIKILSYAAEWDEELLTALIKIFRIEYPLKKSDDLKIFSFIRESDLGGFYIIDENIKTALQSGLSKKEIDSINKFLFDYHNDIIKSIDFKNITEFDKKIFYNGFYYAKNYLEINELAKWFLNYNDKFKLAGLFRFIFPFVNELTKELEKRKTIESEDYVDILISIGTYYKEMGKYNEAKNHFKRSIKILEKIYKEENEKTALCMVHLADVLFGQGDFSSAEPLYLKAIVILNPLKKGESSFSVVSLINVAILFARQRKYDEAISLFEKTLKIRKKTHGEGHPEVDKIYTNIANIEFDRKNYLKAEKLYRKILDSKKLYFGENHPEVGKSMINLGNVLIELSNFEEATSLYGKAKDIFEEFFGNEHPDYAMTLNNLAYLNYITEKFETSKKYYLQALNIYKSILGNEHPDLAILYNNIGRLYIKMKNYDEAEKYLKDSFEINSKNFGFDNLETASTYESLAELFEKLGNTKEAIFYLQKYEKILESKSPGSSEIKTVREKINLLK